MSTADELVIGVASEADAVAITELRIAVARALTARHGRGHWSREPSDLGVRREIGRSTVVVARSGEQLVATLRLATKKPWAIDQKYFVPVKRPLYLLDMVVAPEAQGRAVGRAMVEEARRIACELPADSIRLDAYASAAGAGPFYAKCGFKEVGRVVYRGTPLIYFEWLCHPRGRHDRSAGPAQPRAFAGRSSSTPDTLRHEPGTGRT